MKGIGNRKARFRTIIALIIDEKEYLFEGVVNGSILEIPSGDKGFGYDPVFVPEGYESSFAELPQEEKNKVSHRKRALAEMYRFLTEKSGFTQT